MIRDLRVNRVRVSVCGMATILIQTLLAAHAGAEAAEDWRVEGKDVTYIGDEATATLPQDREWHVMLREYLKTLAAKDFTIEDYAWDTGCVLLGRLPAKFNNVTWTTKDNPWAVHTWPTHHLWGRTAEGVAFSSARQRTPRVQFELDRGRPRVEVAGQLGQGRTVEPGGGLKNAGVLGYRREFEKRENGLYVTSELVCRGDPAHADQLVELVETLPVFLNPVRADQSQDTEIEFCVKQRWQPALAGRVSDVEAVRLRRFHGAIVIEFGRPRQVQLSEVIKTEYQKKDRFRVLHIDLLENGGKPVPIPRRAGVSYLIRAGD